MKSKVIKVFIVIFFVLYLFALFILLFGKGISTRSFRIGGVEEQGYWAAVLSNSNFKPFKTILSYLNGANSFSLRGFQLTQIVGNIILMFPAGIFLPFLWQKQRRFGIFFLTCILCILCVESIQVLTFLGSFDVDDLILNLVGCCIGFGVYRLLNMILMKKATNSDQ